MTTQPEQILEDNLIAQLVELGYTYVAIKDENDLFANFKSQLEKHNKVTLSDTEFKLILNHLNKGNVFDRAKIRQSGRNCYLYPPILSGCLPG